jgi:hypothetical protein
MDDALKCLARWSTSCLFASLCLFATHPSHAQELGNVVRSDMGLKSGTQLPPGYFFTIPLYYVEDYTSVRGPNGNAIPGKVTGDVKLFIPVASVTTKWKLLGANYGFKVAFPISTQAVGSTLVPISKANNYGFGDIYIQPINLGWHLKHIDYLVAYGFYAPTGSGIRSLYQWTHTPMFGVTYYFDSAKKWTIAANATGEIHQVKTNTDILVGNFLTVKGGFGYSFLKGAASAGIDYVGQWKTTHDGGTNLPAILPNTLNKAYGVGPELNFPVFAKGKLAALIGARYVWEFHNSSNFQGNNLALTLTLAKFD